MICHVICIACVHVFHQIFLHLVGNIFAFQRGTIFAFKKENSVSTVKPIFSDVRQRNIFTFGKGFKAVFH